MGKPKSAEAMLTRAVSLWGNYSAAHKRLGDVQAARGKEAKAITSYNNAIEVRTWCLGGALHLIAGR